MEDSFIKYHYRREIDEKLGIKFCRKFHITETTIKRLGLQHELEGHSGCVNSLEWSEDGRILLSGSDDNCIILWNPYLKKILKKIPSGQQGNIFCVKFLPSSNLNIVISAAGDKTIRLHDVSTSKNIFHCACHDNRVKKIAVEPKSPYVFWSAGEDGLVLQFDTREAHKCSRNRSNVLINLDSSITSHRNAEAKCIAINSTRPELLAVGANDPIVRLYDRRIIPNLTFAPPNVRLDFTLRWGNWSNDEEASSDEPIDLPPKFNLPPDCVQYFIPGHFSAKHLRNFACTYIAFSPQGNELLANMVGEQIYLFDINKQVKPTLLDIVKNSSTKCQSTNKFQAGNSSKSSNNTIYLLSEPLPSKVNSFKLKANELFEDLDYDGAVNLCNLALKYCPNAAVLYGNRAQALMKRKWGGDTYAALRDCQKALQLDPNFFRAHFRLIRCLFDLKRHQEAKKCFEEFKSMFPEEIRTSQACLYLEKEIKNRLKKDTKKEKLSYINDDDDPNEYSDNDSWFSPQQKFKSVITSQEQSLRDSAIDFKQRFCGHCNTTTDIKEVNFFGNDGQYIVAGSDEGNFFIWDRQTTNIVKILKGDNSIVNCLQPHPYDCLLATSGIESVIRLWVPQKNEFQINEREVRNIKEVASENQKRMNDSPLEISLLGMGYQLSEFRASEGSYEQLVQCRAS